MSPYLKKKGKKREGTKRSKSVRRDERDVDVKDLLRKRNSLRADSGGLNKGVAL